MVKYLLALRVLNGPFGGKRFGTEHLFLSDKMVRYVLVVSICVNDG